MTKTTNYQLNQWAKSDRVMMDDFNADNAKIDAALKANADAIRLLNEAMPTDKVLALRSLEALAKVANGKATKIIIPSDLQNLGGVVPSIKELMTDPKDAE
jgi:regulator of protease activity HflC (stomatin/prohibitin superfamily)